MKKSGGGERGVERGVLYRIYALLRQSVCRFHRVHGLCMGLTT